MILIDKNELTRQVVFAFNACLRGIASDQYEQSFEATKDITKKYVEDVVAALSKRFSN